MERTIGFWQIFFPAGLGLGWRIPHLHPLWQTVTASALELLQNIRDNMRGSAGAKCLSCPQLSAPACWQCREQCSCPWSAPFPWQPPWMIHVTAGGRGGLYKPLLPLLQRMSQLSCQCAGRVQAHFTWSKARQLHNPSFGRNRVHTYSPICCSVVSAWWGLQNCFNKHGSLCYHSIQNLCLSSAWCPVHAEICVPLTGITSQLYPTALRIWSSFVLNLVKVHAGFYNRVYYVRSVVRKGHSWIEWH